VATVPRKGGPYDWQKSAFGHRNGNEPAIGNNKSDVGQQTPEFSTQIFSIYQLCDEQKSIDRTVATSPAGTEA